MIIHDSRKDEYRKPFGAQPTGGKVKISIDCDEIPAALLLRLWWDDHEQLIVMANGKKASYQATIDLPETAGLMWYYFIINTQDGRTLYYGNAQDGLGGEGCLYDHEPPSFQITVYDKQYDTPDWMKSGIMYHVMVDRFHASKPASEREPLEHGYLHMEWHEPPAINLDPLTDDNIAEDFFGGDLRGIEQKLPYLQDLGVTVLYLSPIFKSPSNHKYNTGDYMRIDPLFGTSFDFKRLCAAAEKLNMKVMLDGVFSHTGSDSLYFNKNGHYEGAGAYQSKRSRFYSWYDFINWPDEYDTWWGFQTLPVVNKRDRAFLDYILEGEDSVFAHWLRAGAQGWRLDVADELPMDMLRGMRKRLKRENHDGALLGEVWEDASKKVAYDELRCYCLGDTLDSVMNYPLRTALFDFLRYRSGANSCVRHIDSLRESYPDCFFRSLMNLVGSHDRARAINVLSDAFDMEPPRAQRSARALSDRHYALGKARLLLSLQAIMAMPGMPSLYYGDEAGMQGMSDPFCRGTYPWGREDMQLLESVKSMIRRRKADAIWTQGELRLYAPDDDVMVIARRLDGRIAFAAVNRAEMDKQVMISADDWFKQDIQIDIPALGAAIL